MVVFYFILVGIVIALDQWSKWLVLTKMSLRESIPIIDEVLYLTSHRNKGAAFGILQDQRWFFIIVTSVVIIAIAYVLIRHRSSLRGLVSWSLALILGGAIGNYIDRVRFGEVVDFVDVKISLFSFYYDFPIFNIADSALVIGVGLLLLDTIIDMIKEKKEKKAAISE
ncbi:signal peptidase II [Bacillus horti]|uniref:Lipoprotein signal peptidase n=1 Tax=Caldalkalibacillus horti TaxID=77523 RepID=A0ABT9VUH2_9BACI|nr:signal peptidase II [Bacillus horti]MDQ0164633.1 signal peptidase II [Bacillus horti]